MTLRELREHHSGDFSSWNVAVIDLAAESRRTSLRSIAASRAYLEHVLFNKRLADLLLFHGFRSRTAATVALGNPLVDVFGVSECTLKEQRLTI